MDKGLDQSEIRCRSCGYDLRTLTSFTCPECGTLFDPRLPATYLSRPASGLRSLLWEIVCLALMISPLLFWSGFGKRMISSGMEWAAIIGLVIGLVGFAISTAVASQSVRALNGRKPWIIHRWAFVAAAALGSLVYLAFLGAVGSTLIWRLMQ